LAGVVHRDPTDDRSDEEIIDAIVEAADCTG